MADRLVRRIPKVSVNGAYVRETFTGVAGCVGHRYSSCRTIRRRIRAPAYTTTNGRPSLTIVVCLFLSVAFRAARRSAPRPDPIRSSTNKTCSGPWTKCGLYGWNRRHRRRRRRPRRPSSRRPRRPRLPCPRPRSRSSYRNGRARCARSSTSSGGPNTSPAATATRRTQKTSSRPSVCRPPSAIASRRGRARPWPADSCWKRRRNIGRTRRPSSPNQRRAPWRSPRPFGTRRRPRPTDRSCPGWACRT